ncbi:MAG: hypothetical protein NTZ09_16010 [Candidatus Hydrogenedentes bacterium]|nr:hypothetical protein [Candidatus Hydrogenedentota bacterium]
MLHCESKRSLSTLAVPASGGNGANRYCMGRVPGDGGVVVPAPGGVGLLGVVLGGIGRWPGAS